MSSARATRRALTAEYRRWRGDVIPWLFLPLTLLPVLSMSAALPPDLGSAPPAMIDSAVVAIRPSLLASVVLFSAVLGGFPVALAAKTGTLAREFLFSRVRPALSARALSSTVSSVGFGVVGVIVMEVACQAATGRGMWSATAEAGRAVAVIATAGLWGFLVGVLVRSPVLVLFVVPLTLSPAMLLVDIAPDIAAVLPLGALLSVAGAWAGGLSAPAAMAVVSVWLFALAAVTALVVHRRDRL